MDCQSLSLKICRWVESGKEKEPGVNREITWLQRAKLGPGTKNFRKKKFHIKKKKKISLKMLKIRTFWQWMNCWWAGLQAGACPGSKVPSNTFILWFGFYLNTMSAALSEGFHQDFCLLSLQEYSVKKKYQLHQPLGKYEAKSQWDTTYHSLGWL